MKNISFQKGSVGLVVLVIVLSVVILGGAIGGALWYNKLQNTNDKLPTNFNNQNPNTQTGVIPSETEESLAGETDGVVADPTADWKTYTNEEYGFSFKYPATIDAPDRSITKSEEWKVFEFDPDETNKKSGSKKYISIGPESSRSGGFIWGMLVYDASKKNIISLMKESGSQFKDRKENIENVVINGETWKYQTVTTETISDWVGETFYLEKNGNIFYITNGAIGSGNIASTFDIFYKTFKFTNNATSVSDTWQQAVLKRFKDVYSPQSISYQIPKTWVANEAIYDNAGSRADYSSGDKMVLSVYNQDVPSTFGTSKLGISNIQDQTINNHKVKFWEYNNKKYYSFPTDDKDQYSFKFEFANTVESKTITDILNLVNF